MILKPIHVVVIRNILDNILLQESMTWKCRDCGAETSGLSEVCFGCQKEFGVDGKPLMP